MSAIKDWLADHQGLGDVVGTAEGALVEAALTWGARYGHEARYVRDEWDEPLLAAIRAVHSARAEAAPHAREIGSGTEERCRDCYGLVPVCVCPDEVIFCTKCRDSGFVPLFAGAGETECPQCYPRRSIAEQAQGAGAGDAILVDGADIRIVAVSSDLYAATCAGLTLDDVLREPSHCGWCCSASHTTEACADRRAREAT
jgi:hypothetical protein